MWDNTLVQQIKQKKHLGQNFLIDKEIIDLIIDSAEIKKDEVIIEPGSGTGAVTDGLVKTGANIVAIEIDTDLTLTLESRFETSENFELKIESVLDTSFESLSKGKKYKIVGSIPYQISSPLIHKILFEKVKPVIVCIVLQKEVAEKVV